MKNIIVLLLMLLTTVNAYEIEEHDYSTTEWDVWLGLAYNGYNYCSGYVDVFLSGDQAFEETMTETQDDWELIETLNYGPNSSCNVTLEVYGIFADLNFTVNYTRQTTSTIYGPLASEYSEGEGYYDYITPSTNHINYSSICNDIFYCNIDVINNTDNSTLYTQSIAGQYTCNNLIPYSFNLSYGNTTSGNANTTFYALPYGYRSNRTLYKANPDTCILGTSYYCNITVTNTTDDSILYTASISATDNNCLQFNNSGGQSINNGNISNTSCSGTCILGQTWTQFRLFISLMISILILVSIKPFKFGAISSAISLDFFALVLPGNWIIETTSVILLYNVVAIMMWFSEGEK